MDVIIFCLECKEYWEKCSYIIVPDKRGIHILFYQFLHENIHWWDSLTIVMLNKLRCHAHFQFSNWSRLLILIHILNDKQCRSRSAGFWGWLGGAKVLCILHHWGVQLILAYSWARPAILVVGKGRGGMFLFLPFLHFLSCSSFFPVPLFHLLYSLFYLFSPFLWETTQNDPQGLTCR